jgi:hypothetical protein
MVCFRDVSVNTLHKGDDDDDDGGGGGGGGGGGDGDDDDDIQHTIKFNDIEVPN